MQMINHIYDLHIQERERLNGGISIIPLWHIDDKIEEGGREFYICWVG